MHAQFGDACARAKDVRWLGDQDEHGVRFYPVRHESIDFSALVHIAESPRLFSNVRQWFYMHDTCDVGRGFWPNATRWCESGLPACALPLTRSLPSSSMGLYDAAFLARHAADILALKNARALPIEKWKKRGFGWEDKLFKVCDAESPVPIRRFTRRCFNATIGRRTCICSNLAIDETPKSVYGPLSTPRQEWRFECADVVKYKANYRRNLSLVLQP